MRKILVAVDGSAGSERAVRHLISQLGEQTQTAEVHVLYAQPPVSDRLLKLATDDFIEGLRRDVARKATATADKLLSEAGLRHVVETKAGMPAETIASYARQNHCDEIVMGTRGLGTISNLLLGSVATKVVHAADAPVTLVK